MACYHPVQCWRSKDVNPSGKRSLVFNVRQAQQPDDPLAVPCGQCIGCRLKYSANWALRCHHEASLWEDNCFLTLTFDDKHLPPDGSISVKDCQDFMKRLRRQAQYHLGRSDIRMAYCGEYGEKTGRPHYHFLIFNFDFPDKYEWSKRNGFMTYRSPMLERVWPFGNSEIGSVTFESAAYVARYITKKFKGKDAADHYLKYDLETGEITGSYTPEFFRTSRRPGIAKRWIEKFPRDVYPKDFVTVDGREIRPPKYYDSQFEIVDPWMMDDVKEKRMLAMKKAHVHAENTYERRRVREKVKLAEIQSLKRRYEHGT